MSIVTSLLPHISKIERYRRYSTLLTIRGLPSPHFLSKLSQDLELSDLPWANQDGGNLITDLG